MTSEGFSLFAFLQALVERLSLDAQVDRAEVATLVGGIRDDLAAMTSEYEQPPPAGLEAINALMVELLLLFDLSCQQVLAFLETDDEVYLTGALAQAEEAEDVLMTVRELVVEQKNLLSEMADTY